MKVKKSDIEKRAEHGENRERRNKGEYYRRAAIKPYQLSDDQTIQMSKTFFKMGHVCISRAI